MFHTKWVELRPFTEGFWGLALYREAKARALYGEVKGIIGNNNMPPVNRHKYRQIDMTENIVFATALAGSKYLL